MTTAAASLIAGRTGVRGRRRTADRIMTLLITLAAAASAALVLALLAYLIANGAPALNVAFFTQRPLPFGEPGGGVAPAIVGTLLLSAIAALIAIPVGIASAIFVVEFRTGRYAGAVRFAAELIAGLPSIVVGVFVWAFLVRGVIGHYAALAGGISLAIIMIPLVARTTEEVLRLVPTTLREAALALGAPRWRVVLRIVVPTARAGITTAAVLALARAAGETAPLLMTALGNLFFSTDLFRPIAALPLQIYQYAASPYDDWHAKAWAGSLVLVLVVGLLSAGLRAVTRSRVR